MSIFHVLANKLEVHSVLPEVEGKVEVCGAQCFACWCCYMWHGRSLGWSASLTSRFPRSCPEVFKACFVIHAMCMTDDQNGTKRATKKSAKLQLCSLRSPVCHNRATVGWHVDKRVTEQWECRAAGAWGGGDVLWDVQSNWAKAKLRKESQVT